MATAVKAEIIEQTQIAKKQVSVLDEIEEINYMVSKINTQDDVEIYLKRLKDLEKLLKAADEFRRMAEKYIRLEASVYSRIITLGMVDDVPAKQYGRKVVEWFSGLNKEQRDSIIDECAKSGMTINAYWKNVVHERDMVEREIKYMEQEAQDAIEEFTENGTVELGEFFRSADKPNSRIPRDVVAGYKDQTRKKIRELGGHGLGDDKGTYMTKEKAAEASNDIVRNKVKSIAADVQRLKSFLDCGSPLDLPIKTKHTSSFDLSEESSINLMLALCGVGTVDFETQQYHTRVKICARLLNRLGTNPYELFNDLILYSVQRQGEIGGLVDLTKYGWPEKEAQEIQQHYEKKRQETSTESVLNALRW